MKLKIKKTAALLLSAIVMTGTISGCSALNGLFGEKDTDGIKYETLLNTQAEKTLGVDETATFSINKNIVGKEYVCLNLKTNVPLLGEFVYSDVNDATKVVREEFFVEASDGVEIVEFKQFLDKFRDNGIGQFDKVLKEVTLTNKGGTAGTVAVESLKISNRKVPDYELEVYIESGELKVGADLAVGGTLTYLERTSYTDQDGVKHTIDEVLTEDNEIYIGVNAKENENTQQTYSSKVNLINIYDAGRQIQQSYYANVGGDMGIIEPGTGGNYVREEHPANYGANGYNRAWCTTANSNGYYWPYNPVQGGDCACNLSQIIDYNVTDNEIYIKVRAMDWAKGDDGRRLDGTVVGGVTTKSYMENWYTIKGNVLYVKNRFIDWNGFTDMDTISAHSNELPATYISHPLNNYVCYTGERPWTGGALTYEAELGSWAAGAHKNAVHKEDWFAWVNDEDFGVGMYIPNTVSYASGRSNASTNINYEGNKDAYRAPLANEYRFNKPEATYPQQSCYTTNTSYTAPVVSWRMKTYLPMQYEYAIVVDYIPIMRETFKQIYDSGILTNETLDDWS